MRPTLLVKPVSSKAATKHTADRRVIQHLNRFGADTRDMAVSYCSATTSLLNASL